MGTTVWPLWNDTSVTSATCATHDVWSYWQGTVSSVTSADVTWKLTSVSSTSNTLTWQTWQIGDLGTGVHRVRHVPVSAEEAARRRRMDEEWRAGEANRRKEREAAKGRARKLLCESLTRAQREQYEKNGYFDVAVAGKTYRIHQGTHGNVRLLNEKGESVTSYCVQPNNVPDEDAMLAQKLALELAPQEFFAKANARQLRN